METLKKNLLNKFTITVARNTELPFLNKYGIVDQSGKTILKPLFHAIWELNDYLIGYRFGSKFGIVGKDGKRIIDPILKGNIYYSEGRRKKDGFLFAEEFYTRQWNNGEYLAFDIDVTFKTFLISKTGEVISNGEFSIIAESTRRGYCLVANNDKWGLFNVRKKKLIIDTIYPHGYLNSIKKGSSIVATTISLGGKEYKLNERTEIFERVVNRK